MKRPVSHLSTLGPGGEAGEWFRRLADTTSTAIFLFRGRFLYVNPASVELCGYSAAELSEMTVWDLIHPDHHARTRQREHRRARERRGQRYELEIVRKDGAVRWIDLSIGTIEVAGRHATAGTAIDITERKLAELALTETDDRLKLAQRAGRSVTWEWEPASDRMSVSDYADELFGFPVREMVRTGGDFRRFVHPEDRDRLARALRRTLRRGTGLSVEIRCIPPNGSVRWVAEKAMAITDTAGRTRKIIGVAHDITERKTAEEALFQEKERALVTLASIADGVIRTDADGGVDYLNPAAQRLTGWTLAEAYGRPVDEVYRVVDDATDQPSTNPVARCLREQRNVVFPGDRRLVRRDGARLAVSDSAAPIRSRAGSLIGAILVFKDLSQLRQVEKQIARLASHDALTGLLNRREFEARVTEAVESARREDRRHALAHLDLDQFRLVNDTAGRAAGDQLIVRVASLVGSCLADHDLLARLGSDEFGVLMWNREPKAASELVDRMIRTVSEHRFSWHGKVHPISASAGLVPLTRDSRDAASLLGAADAACYVAKEQGGNRLHRYRRGDTTIAERHGQMQWISLLQKALDDGRLSIFQQPIVSLRREAEAWTFCELLIRMTDESGQLVEPHRFIPAAEKYGMITAIDRWMVGTALDHLAASDHDSPRRGPRFGINLSGQSLSEQGFLEFVVDQFARTGAEPRRIYFEITETAAIADLAHATRFLSELRRMGCRFVLDDFGKGLSSFSYLQNLPVDFLKIDGGFVRNLTTDPIQAALVGSIHEIGRVLGLRTIAESVEDQVTLDAVRRIGVDYAQGFYVARPEPLVAALRQPRPTPKP